jgi:aryl-alcohol dehydrogenase-like predicted oxidoreductase
MGYSMDTRSPQVTTVIPGATKVEQVEKNMAASDLTPLDKQTHHKLRICMMRKFGQR